MARASPAQRGRFVSVLGRGNAKGIAQGKHTHLSYGTVTYDDALDGLHGSCERDRARMAWDGSIRSVPKAVFEQRVRARRQMCMFARRLRCRCVDVAQELRCF
jgi:hypothetical protein